MQVDVKKQKLLVKYKPNINLFEMFKEGKIVQVYIPLKQIIHHYLDDLSTPTKTSPKCYGYKVYTDFSDILQVCRHLGILKREDLVLKRSIVKGFLVDVIIGPPRFHEYPATFTNHVRSSSCHHYDGNSITIVNHQWIFDIPLTFGPPKLPSDSSMTEGDFFLSSAVIQEEEFTDIADGLIVEYKKKALLEMTQAEKEHYGFIPEMTFMFNLMNDPWMKYSLTAIADTEYPFPLIENNNKSTSQDESNSVSTQSSTNLGQDERNCLKRQYGFIIPVDTQGQIMNAYDKDHDFIGVTQALFIKNVLYFECLNDVSRYELKMIYNGQSTAFTNNNSNNNNNNNNTVFLFTLSKLNCPLLSDDQMRKEKIPLMGPNHNILVLAQNIMWNEIRWGQDTLLIKGISYFIQNFKFFPINQQ